MRIACTTAWSLLKLEPINITSGTPFYFLHIYVDYFWAQLKSMDIKFDMKLHKNLKFPLFTDYKRGDRSLVQIIKFLKMHEMDNPNHIGFSETVSLVES